MNPAENKVSYKDTLHLPVTEFPMKGNLPVREPEFIARWKEKSIYEKMVSENSPKGEYVMPDGPPYANGNIHIGHVLNKVLKDIVIKYRNLAGHSAAFIPGWDCHGLPIEHKVTKELGAKRKDKTDADIRQLCRDEANLWVNKQREQFIRLGILSDWENPYLTIQPEYEAEEVREIGRILDKGILYRGEKPVYWCWALQTALAEAEVEYAEHKSPSIYVKFPLNDETKLKFLSAAGASVSEIQSRVKDESLSFVIWTTTPWTLPANLGIALNKDFDYGIFEYTHEFKGQSKTELLIMAAEMQETIESATELSFKKLATVKGSVFEGLAARHPFYDRDSKIVYGDHVTLEAGTGCVHTAPGHGQEDYQVGLEYGLDVYSPVDARGCYTNEVPEYEGTRIFDANPLIVERMREDDSLLHFSEFKHSYPHCWRSKTPLIFRATPQWFLKMDDEKHNIRSQALKALDDVRFVPKWGEKRIRSMVENRPDWCLSRQRAWGVPIPVFYCENCGKELLDKEVIEKVASKMEASGGIEAYFEGDAKEFVDGKSCSACSSTEFRKGKDILDVWFDSGVCHAAVQNRRDGLASPADIYLEGSDQHRGWFQTSLLSSIASTGKAPFKALVTHGFVNDAKGRKMSKSLGNVIDPAEWIKKSGAEILRLFAAYEDYGQDLSCGPENFKRITESYRRYRNTMRFLLGNIGDFDINKDRVAVKDMMPLDQWALHRLNELVKRVTENYENYDFYKVYHALNHFMTVEMSATYLDILKDRLYTWRKDGTERRAAQTVIYELCLKLSSIMAPILSFLAEETFDHLPNFEGEKPESIFLVPFPVATPEWEASALDEEFSLLFEVRSTVLKRLEELRAEKVIRASLEAQVEVSAKGATLEALKKYSGSLAQFFIVSQANVVEGDAAPKVEKASGEKCERCWHYDELTDENSKNPGICKKCDGALS